MNSHQCELLKTQQIPSGHTKQDCIVRRINAEAKDGALVPITLLRMFAAAWKEVVSGIWMENQITNTTALVTLFAQHKPQSRSNTLAPNPLSWKAILPVAY